MFAQLGKQLKELVADKTAELEEQFKNEQDPARKIALWDALQDEKYRLRFSYK